MSEEEFAEKIAAAIDRHEAKCILRTEQIPARLRTVETRFGVLVGLMIGSGLLAGSVSGALVKLLP
jgi:hypothetical protein